MPLQRSARDVPTRTASKPAAICPGAVDGSFRVDPERVDLRLPASFVSTLKESRYTFPADVGRPFHFPRM